MVFVGAILPSLLCGGCAGRKDSHPTTSRDFWLCFIQALIAVLVSVVGTKLSSSKSLKW